jgi:hypothetical protein
VTGIIGVPGPVTGKKCVHDLLHRFSSWPSRKLTEYPFIRPTEAKPVALAAGESVRNPRK